MVTRNLYPEGAEGKLEGTPGPWEVVEHSWAETSIYGGGRPIATLSIERDCDEDTQEEWERRQAADARLIALAPQMKAMLEYPPSLPTTFDQYDRFAADYRRWRGDAKALLAKAWGL